MKGFGMNGFSKNNGLQLAQFLRHVLHTKPVKLLML